MNEEEGGALATLSVHGAGGFDGQTPGLRRLVTESDWFVVAVHMGHPVW